MRRVGGAAVAGALLAGLLTSIASTPRSEAGVGSVSDPVTTPRVAFTDDRDEVRRSTLTRTGSGTSEKIVAAESELVSDPTADHSGEASSDGAGDNAFISTTGDDPEGEVWINEGPPSGLRRQVTCNHAIETHPVLSIVDSPGDSLRFEVLFASNLDGDWDIYEATETSDQPSPSPASPAALASPAGCAGWTVVNRTGPGPDENQDLWPSFSPDGDGIIFSRSGPKDPLGDIYEASLGCACGSALAPVSAIFPIIEDPASADTQPNVVAFINTKSQREIWLAWTRTKTRPEGTVALTQFNPLNGKPSNNPPYAVYEPFPAGTSEPAWGGIYTDRYLAYSTNEVDPYGDVRLAQLTQPTPGTQKVGDVAGKDPIGPAVRNTVIVSGEPGVAESHPSGVTPFVYANPDYRADVLFTRDSLDADVSAAPTDGSGARTALAHAAASPGGGSEPIDQAGPSYAPDGQHLVYSEAGSTFRGGRRLVIADADGSRARYLDAGHYTGDIDVDPVWSPDGKHIAFTRYVNGNGDPDAWVVDISPTLVETTPRRITGDPPDPDYDYVDVHPSWSPDSSKVVVARAEEYTGEGTSDAAPPPPPISRAQPAGPETNLTTELWVLDAVADGPDRPVLLPPACGRCTAQRIPARTPAWSPDGRTIAYEALGALQTVRLAAAPTENGWSADDHRSVTGFEGQDQTGQPTSSRSVISSAEEPAWSTDGSELAFTGQPAGQPRQRGIWAIKPDGTGLRLVTDLHPDRPALQDDQRGPDTEPAWEPTHGTDLTVTIALTGGSPLYVGAPRTATVTVLNRGPLAAENVALTATYPATGVVPTSTQACLVSTTACALGTLLPGRRLTFPITLTPMAATTGPVIATVTSDTSDPVLANNKATLPIVVLQPAVRLLPAVARPGMVVLAYGENMPPGSKVRLSWSRGVTADPGPYTVAKDGTLRAGMLIVRRDLVGDRLLVATSVGNRFSPVTGAVLVAPRVLDTGLWSRG